MREVSTRAIPGRRVASVSRHVTITGAEAFFAEAFPRLRALSPGLPGIEGAPYVVYYGEVSQDSDGPVEWCKPVPATEAEGLAAQFPELTLRVEPAHREAYVDLGPGGQISPAQWQLADEALRSWADAQGIHPKQKQLSLIIGRMSGIESATVLYDEEVKVGLSRQKQKTASVAVQTRAGQLDNDQVKAIRNVVASAYAGM